MAESEMVTVAQLLRRYAERRDDVFAALYREWPDEDEHEYAYREVWDALLLLGGQPTEIICVVHRFNAPVVGEPFIDVSGIVPGDAQRYAIEYEPWERWLNMPVQIAASDIAEETAVALILYEMTWAGYDQNTIQEQLGEIKEAASSVTAALSSGRREAE